MMSGQGRRMGLAGRWFAAAVVVGLAGGAWAQDGAGAGSPVPATVDNSLAFQRTEALRRGVNLSGWYGGWREYSPEHLANWTNAADFTFIRATGLGYVRLCIDPVQLLLGGYGSETSLAAFARLDRSIDQILAAGLSLSITMFPRDDYKAALLTPAGQQAFTDLWKYLAGHYAGRDPERVFFDLMNEPEVKDPARWDVIQGAAVEAIRSVDQAHTIIATGSRYSGIDELVQVTPVRDANTVYTFHFYEPFPFTHQGATWSSPAFVHLKDVPYPATEALLVPMIAATTDPAAKEQLEGYASQGWDEAVLVKRIGQAKAWGEAHHVPVICNEFGAYRTTIPEATRARYLGDVRLALETLKMPWAEWDYRGNFGIVSHTADGVIVPDVPVLEALGLTVPAPPPMVLPAMPSAPSSPGAPVAPPPVKAPAAPGVAPVPSR